MAPAVGFAFSRRRQQCAVFLVGDERGRAPLPPGWEPLEPAKVFPDPADLERFAMLGLRERLERICPPGFKAVHPAKGDYFLPSSPPASGPGRLVVLGLAAAIGAVAWWLLAR